MRSTVQLSSDDPAKPASELSDRPKFNVVIVYEDRAAGRRAKYFYDNLIHELEDECDFSLELWSFQVLAIFNDWAFSRASRRPSRLRHSLITWQSWASCRD